jgi:hypothetical protein
MVRNASTNQRNSVNNKFFKQIKALSKDICCPGSVEYGELIFPIEIGEGITTFALSGQN